MIPQESTWAHLERGAYMKDKTGKTWRCIGVMPDGVVGVVDRAGTVATLAPRDPQTPVTMVVPTWDEAIANVATILGGTPIGRN